MSDPLDKDCGCDDKSRGEGGDPPNNESRAKLPTRSRGAFTKRATEELSFLIWQACQSEGDLRSNILRAMERWKARYIK